MKKFQWWKWLLTGTFFLLVHFAYENFPNNFVLIFGANAEAIFLHMKMVFWAYLFSSVVEYFVRRKSISSVSQFIYVRLLLAVISPWLIIVVWFTSRALGIAWPDTPSEIIYANIVSAIGFYAALRLEELLDDTVFRPALRAVIVVLFALMLLDYISFTFNPLNPEYFFLGPAD